MSFLLVCSGCVSTEEWAVVEITETIGVRVHARGQHRFVVGGDPADAKTDWAKAHDSPVRWTLAPHGATSKRGGEHWWPIVMSGDLSKDGLLAVARGRGRHDRCPWLTEIYRMSDGKLIAQIENYPLAVAWSNDGDTLAVLEVGGEGHRDDPVQLVLRQVGGRVIAKWHVNFDPFALLYSSPMNNRFGVSWNADDSCIAVSTLAIPKNAMDPRCTIVRVAEGPVCSIAASNAYFVGVDLIAANEGAQWSGAWLMRLTGDHLEKVEPIAGQLFVAGSDPAAGVYIAWHPPPLWPPKAFSLPLAFHDLSGDWPVEQTGFRIHSSLRLVRAQRVESLLGGGVLLRPLNELRPRPDSGLADAAAGVDWRAWEVSESGTGSKRRAKPGWGSR